VAAVLRGVDVHQDVLRYATSGAGNDHRLGGHEAPPAIFSVYLGDAVGAAVNEIAGKKFKRKEPIIANLGVNYLPKRDQDNTDRNRTSPVAFTGNKFEVRCVGSSQTPAISNLVLNTITAESFNYLSAEIEKEKASGKSIDKAIYAVLHRVFKEHLRIVNDGDGYSHEWPKEAAKRGLLNLQTTPEVLEKVNSDKNRNLFAKYGVWNEREFNANVEVDTERYFHQIHLEAQSLRNIVDRYVLPAGLDMYGKVRANAESISPARLNKIKSLNLSLSDKSEKLANVTTHLSGLGGTLQGGKFAVAEVIPLMRSIRESADELETITDAKLWPLPTYEEMLFERHEL
jgi:glutamine synthetase